MTLRKMRPSISRVPNLKRYRSIVTVRAVLIEELGGEPDQFFAQIDPLLLAGASLAQVHAGKRG